MNLMWWIALAIAVYLIATLVFANPFKDETDERPPNYERGWRDFYK
jgi:hypothetical protein